MVAVPAAILFVNDDLAASTRSHLIRQLHITDVQDGYDFDAHVAANANYPDEMRQLNRRLMVVRTFWNRGDYPEIWAIPDVVIFVKQGLASVERNNFGPPGLTLPVLKLYWGALGIFDRA